MNGYDDWKTACCNLYPNCNHCPYDDSDDVAYDEDDEDEDDDAYESYM